MSAVTVGCRDAEVLAWCKANGIEVQLYMGDTTAVAEWETAWNTGTEAYRVAMEDDCRYRLVLPSEPVECSDPSVLAWWVAHVAPIGGKVEANDTGTLFDSVETTARGFRRCIGFGITYRLVSPSPTVDPEPAPTEQEQDTTGEGAPYSVSAELIHRVFAALIAMTDDEPCREDHDGRCQTHGLVKVNGRCGVRFARSVAAEISALTPSPAPSPVRPEGLPADAVEVPWFDHPAWVVPPGSRMDRSWEFLLTRPDPEWRLWEQVACGGYRIVRPTPAPSVPATERVPLLGETFNPLHLHGRTLSGAAEPIIAVRWSRVFGQWQWLRSDREWACLPVAADGTVEVLASPSSDRGEG